MTFTSAVLHGWLLKPRPAQGPPPRTQKRAPRGRTARRVVGTLAENAGRPPADRRAATSGNHRVLRDELVVVRTKRGAVLAVVPVIPDAAPYKVREGIARRRIAALEGECPCGATAEAGDDGNLVFQHQRLCPAETGRLGKELRRWAR